MGASQASCCCASRCGGQPHIVSIGDDARLPVHSLPNDEDLATERWEEDIPEWIYTLSPGLPPRDAAVAAREWARCAQDLRRRTRTFVQKAREGLVCRVLAGGKAAPATASLDEGATRLTVVEPASAGRCGREHECPLADIYNIWVCADSALARRAHGAVSSGAQADLACIVLVDAPAGPLGLVMRSSEAREEFLDCMAALIAAQRLRTAPGLARCDLPGGLPPPEAQLRPVGRSLQSAHLSGPICAWLARIGEEAIAGDVEDGQAADGAAKIMHLPAAAPSSPTAGTELTDEQLDQVSLPMSPTQASPNIGAPAQPL
mmetsp:Transcript_9364/g.26889  ORF Transcript_9364/g.26889 Transcript_9364/m.26889 type:complete len:318 (-) Transcript_9364:21-974(-)